MHQETLGFQYQPLGQLHPFLALRSSHSKRQQRIPMHLAANTIGTGAKTAKWPFDIPMERSWPIFLSKEVESSGGIVRSNFGRPVHDQQPRELQWLSLATKNGLSVFWAGFASFLPQVCFCPLHFALPLWQPETDVHWI